MTVRYRTRAGVATLTMDSPSNRNALTPALIDGLADQIDRANADQRVRVLVLTNTGSAFCAGADLKAARGGMDHDRGMGLDLPALLTKVADSPKPVIARIAGHCMGGGVGLAAACDLSVAADDVRFGFTEVRIGVAPAIISVVCLAKLRRGDAMELFLTGERVSAARAAEVGLINRAVPRPSLAAEVSRIAGAVMAGGPGALGAAKRLVNEVPSMPTTEAFRYTAALSAELFGSAEASEGMAAFREKRPADWAPGR